MKIVADTTQKALLLFAERQQSKSSQGRVLLRFDREQAKLVAIEENSLNFIERFFLFFDRTFYLQTIATHLKELIESRVPLSAPTISLVDKKIEQHNGRWFASKIATLSQLILKPEQHAMIASSVDPKAAQREFVVDWLSFSQNAESLNESRSVFRTAVSDDSKVDALYQSVLVHRLPERSPLQISVHDLYEINKEGLIIQKSDGNCLLTSFATGLSVLQKKQPYSQKELRKMVCDYIESHYLQDSLLYRYLLEALTEFNEDMAFRAKQLALMLHTLVNQDLPFREVFEQYERVLQVIRTIPEYIQRAREDSFWCSSPQLYALSELFKVSIHVHDQNNLKRAPYCIICPNHEEGVVHLAFKKNHYNTFVPPDKK